MNPYIATVLIVLSASGCLLLGAWAFAAFWGMGGVFARIAGIWFALAFLSIAVGIVLQGVGVFS